MKAIVIKAMVKELSNYLKQNPELDQEKIIEIQKKLSKVQNELLDYSSKLLSLNNS